MGVYGESDQVTHSSPPIATQAEIKRQKREKQQLLRKSPEKLHIDFTNDQKISDIQFFTNRKEIWVQGCMNYYERLHEAGDVGEPVARQRLRPQGVLITVPQVANTTPYITIWIYSTGIVLIQGECFREFENVFYKIKEILDNNHGDTTSKPIKNDTVLHENCVLDEHLSSQTNEDDVILTETDAKLTAADDEHVSVENSKSPSHTTLERGEVHLDRLKGEVAEVQDELARSNRRIDTLLFLLKERDARLSSHRQAMKTFTKKLAQHKRRIIKQTRANEALIEEKIKLSKEITYLTTKLYERDMLNKDNFKDQLGEPLIDDDATPVPEFIEPTIRRKQRRRMENKSVTNVKNARKPTDTGANIPTVVGLPTHQQTSQVNNKTIPIIGDSNLRHMGRIINTNLIHNRDVNATACVFTNPGMRVEDLLRRLPNFLGDKLPGVPDVILHVGTNNIETELLQTTIDRFKRLVLTVNKHAQDRVFHLTEVPPQHNVKTNVKIQQLNVAIKDMCKESTNVRFIQSNLDPLLHLRDNDIHLNWHGKQELANVIGSVVAAAVSSAV